MQKIDVVSQCSFLLEKANNKLLWLLVKNLNLYFFSFFFTKINISPFSKRPRTSISKKQLVDDKTRALKS